MNRRIRKRLVAHGHALAPPAEELRTTEKPCGTDDPCAVDKLRAADEKSFFDWFQQDVLGLDSEEYRRAFWREAYRTGHTIGPMPRTFKSWQRERGVPLTARAGDMIFILIFVGGPSLAFWYIRKAIRNHIRRVRRPTYYEVERERRIALAQTRRRQNRRWTTNPRPSLDAIRTLFAQVRRNPEAALRLGGLLEDLECYLDNRPRFKGDRCLGRAGGIKRHLQQYAPDLFEHYSALMRYKAIAKRFRQAGGIADPVPADALLPSAAAARATSSKIIADGSRTVGSTKVEQEAEILAKDAVTASALEAARARAAEIPAESAGTASALEAARARAAEILAEGAGTVIALEAALALRLDPDCIPAVANLAAVRTKRTPPRILDWLRRRRSA